MTPAVLGPVCSAQRISRCGVHSACAAGVNAPWDSFAASSLGSPVSVFSILTLLSLLPFGMIALTTFTRNIVALSPVRHARGLQQTPPNIVLIVLALFLTLFIMAPTLEST
ncbi:hypothetical protein HU761_25960, partial [Pseudomonas sp. SWRI59]|nr:hypothetical protein [Pseudomonas sp. SWRI59]